MKRKNFDFSYTFFKYVLYTFCLFKICITRTLLAVGPVITCNLINLKITHPMWKNI